MKGKIKDIQIAGMVTAVPDNVVDNQAHISSINDKRLKRQIKLTGIDTRRVTVENQEASDLATLAADELLKKLQWNRDEIDVMIFVTQSEDIQQPSTAFIIQNQLNIGKKCLVMDINHGCTGYAVGMITICSMLQLTKGKGLLLVGESHAVQEATIPNDMLDGDAAAATALEYVEGAFPISFDTFCDGTRVNLLYKRYNHDAYMDGNAVLLFGLGEVSQGVQDFMRENELSDEDISYYVFHQAQKMIVDGIANALDIGQERLLLSCKEYGNTSSASIPLTICYEKEEKGLTGKQKLLLCGFGIGLSWGILYTEVDMDVVFPIVVSNDSYDNKNMLLKEKSE